MSIHLMKRFELVSLITQSRCLLPSDRREPKRNRRNGKNFALAPWNASLGVES